MAKITVEATTTIQRTKTIEVKVCIADVKEWMKKEFGSPSEHNLKWNNQEVLEEYFRQHENLIDETRGNINDITDCWCVQFAEAV